MAENRAVGGIKRKYPADGVGGFCDGPDSSKARQVKQEQVHREESDLRNGKYNPSQQPDGSVVNANNTIICFGSVRAYTEFILVHLLTKIDLQHSCTIPHWPTCRMQLLLLIKCTWR